ncbi:MAG: hypothetical protein GY719_34435 [bacterium]|nr:hypothetical protein [bacterium]
MAKKVTLLLILGLTAALTPALAEPDGAAAVAASEEVVALKEMASAPVAAVREATAATKVEPLASQAAATPETAVTAVPVALPLFTSVIDTLKARVVDTCVECNTHTDCQGVCSGQPLYDFVCARWRFGCYPGPGPKTCFCT